MRWPWQKREKRQSGGDFYDLVLRQIEAQATGSAADVSSTAAVEAASGALSRAFASAEVVGAGWVQDAVTPAFLGQVGRDLVLRGETLHVIRMGVGTTLVPASSWHFEGDHDPDSWRVRATCYGPSTSSTWNLPFDSVIFVRWGGTPAQPYVGVGPTRWASTSSRLASEAERSLADEASGPLAQLLAIPQDGGDDGDDDPLVQLKADIRGARGRALLLESVAAAWGDGRQAAPSRDWVPARLGPHPPESVVRAADDSFKRVLASCGVPPSLFLDSDGTAQREAVRRWHLNTVMPLAKILEHELTEKLETEVKLKFDTYALDMVSRSQVVAKLTAAGVDVGVALAAVGLEE